MNPTRRSFLRRALHGSAALALTPQLLAQTASRPPPLPALSPELVQATVGQSHRDLAAVQKLVDATPLLANACWDWGGGDFETALQAAAHTGQKEIALYLLSKHARLDIFAAAMLGQLDFVKAAFALDPKVHEIPGPHGFTLLHCARQLEESQPVVDWLLTQGVADVSRTPLNIVPPSVT